MTGEKEPWHADRSLPVAAILTIVVQTGAIFWWASGMSADVEAIKADIARQDAQIEATRATAGAQAVQLGRIEENTRATQAAVERLLLRMEGP